MAKRVQSPSSINLFKQCPRRYYYQYIRKIPTGMNIHLVRGNVVHEALERFYDIDVATIDPMDYKRELALYLKNLFEACWRKKKKALSTLGLGPDKLLFYYHESTEMLANWMNDYFSKLDEQLKANDLIGAFEELRPHSIEEEYKDMDLMVRGFVDVIHKEGQDVIVVDYKTSKKDDITEAYRLQLGIYALLYKKKHGELPRKVGIWFLKTRPKYLDCDEQMIKDAMFEIEQVHAGTESEIICDYPKKKSGLCKYSTGQCDFYDICRKDV